MSLYDNFSMLPNVQSYMYMAQTTSYSDTWDRLIVCAALLGRMYKGSYDRFQGEPCSPTLLLSRTIVNVQFLDWTSG